MTAMEYAAIFDVKMSSLNCRKRLDLITKRKVFLLFSKPASLLHREGCGSLFKVFKQDSEAQNRREIITV
jgi:hypothetical protein